MKLTIFTIYSTCYGTLQYGGLGKPIRCHFIAEICQTAKRENQVLAKIVISFSAYNIQYFDTLNKFHQNNVEMFSLTY